MHISVKAMAIATSEATRSNPLPSSPGVHHAHKPHHHAHAPESNLLPTSREVGVAVPDADRLKGSSPLAKSWAHFVAGGFVHVQIRIFNPGG